MANPITDLSKAAGNRSRRQPLVAALASAALGIVADRYLFSLTFEVWWGLACAAAIAWAGCCWNNLQVSGAWLLLLAVFACGAASHHRAWNVFNEDELALAASEQAVPVCVRARVLSAPKVTPAFPVGPMQSTPATEHSRVRLFATALRDGRHWRAISGLVVLNVSGRLQSLKHGDEVLVCAMLVQPTPAMNPGEFDTAAYLRGNRQLCQLRANSPDCVELIETGAWWLPGRWLDSVRVAAQSLLRGKLGDNRSGLGMALLLGNREQVEPDLEEAFFETGTVHMLSISGMHLAMMAAGLFYLTRASPLTRRCGLLVVLAVTIAYALFTEADSPIVRSAVTVCCVCAAALWGRASYGLNSLAAGGLLVLALNPCDLFRAGTQLSFLAAGCLIVLHSRKQRENEEPLDRLLRLARPWYVRTALTCGRWLWEITMISVSITLVTAPLVLYRFHLLSPVVLVLNTLVWIPAALALGAGFLLLALGWLFAPLGVLLGGICDLNLSLVRDAVLYGAKFDSPLMWFATPSLWWVIFTYAVLAIVLVQRRFAQSVTMRCAAIGTICLVGGADLLWHRISEATEQRERLDCTFISVGHGTAVLLEFPSGEKWLYDCGRINAPDRAAQAVSDTLWSRGITRLDGIIVSHADADHYNGLPVLLKRFRCGQILFSPTMFRARIPPLEYLREAFEKSGAELRQVTAGDALPLAGDARARVLRPPAGEDDGSDNSRSIVLEITWQGRRILLPGDLEEPGFSRWLASPPLDCDVLMAPHHGSVLSNPPQLIDWCRPEYMVISGSMSDAVNQQAGGFRNQRTEALYTALDGAIRCRFTSRGVEVRTWRTDPW